MSEGCPTGAEVYKGTIARPYTAQFLDSLVGAERLRLATEGALRWMDPHTPVEEAAHIAQRRSLPERYVKILIDTM